MLGILAEVATDPFTSILSSGGQTGLTVAILWWVTQRLIPRILDEAKADRDSFRAALADIAAALAVLTHEVRRNSNRDDRQAA